MLMLLLVSCKSEPEGEQGATGGESPVVVEGQEASPSTAPSALDSSGQGQFPDIEGKEWVLAKYTYNGQPERILGDSPVYIGINGNQLTGNGGCNSLQGQVTLKKDGTLDISGVSKTKKICAGVMTQEVRVIELLEGAEAYKVNLVFLELNGPGGQLTFRNDLK